MEEAKCQVGRSKGTDPSGHPTPVLCDAHFHLGFVADPMAFSAQAERAHTPLLAVSVTPGEYRQTATALGWSKGTGPSDQSDRVRLAVGLHPWWVPESEAALASELAAFDAALPETGFVGEVGLDFSKRRVGTREGQLRAFAHIAEACAKSKGKVFSIHCVKAYDDALRILSETGCLETCTCIFHWFSGSFPQLQQAIDAGCFFSVGRRMLQSKKGCEYVRVLPLQRILLETDAPEVSDPEKAHPSVVYGYGQLEAQLEETLQLLAEARDAEKRELAQALQVNAQVVLS